MATLDDLPIRKFSEMSDDELLELIKDSRARRRSPDPVIREQSKKKAIAKKARGKAIALQDISILINGLTKEQAQNLLKTLKGE